MSKPVILFKYPSRGRLNRFFKGLDSIVDNMADQDSYKVLATLDKDDVVMNQPEVIERINGYKNVIIDWGLSTSKINAINRGMPETGWDIVVVASDDIFFNFYGFDEIIRNEMCQNFPDGDGYLHFNEKDSGVHLNVMTVIDKKYYDRFGYIYHPEYISLFCDNHQFDVAKILNKYVYIPYSIMEHLNPAYGYMDRDEMFDEHQKIGWDVDMKKYEEMKNRNYDLHLMKEPK